MPAQYVIDRHCFRTRKSKSEAISKVYSMPYMNILMLEELIAFKFSDAESVLASGHGVTVVFKDITVKILPCKSNCGDVPVVLLSIVKYGSEFPIIYQKGGKFFYGRSHSESFIPFTELELLKEALFELENC